MEEKETLGPGDVPGSSICAGKPLFVGSKQDGLHYVARQVPGMVVFIPNGLDPIPSPRKKIGLVVAPLIQTKFNTPGEPDFHFGAGWKSNFEMNALPGPDLWVRGSMCKQIPNFTRTKNNELVWAGDMAKSLLIITVLSLNVLKTYIQFYRDGEQGRQCGKSLEFNR